MPKIPKMKRLPRPRRGFGQTTCIRGVDPEKEFMFEFFNNIFNEINCPWLADDTLRNAKQDWLSKKIKWETFITRIENRYRELYNWIINNKEWFQHAEQFLEVEGERLRSELKKFIIDRTKEWGIDIEKRV